MGQGLSLAVVQLCHHGHGIQEAAGARSEGGAYISCIYILATSTANNTYSVASDIKYLYLTCSVAAALRSASITPGWAANMRGKSPSWGEKSFARYDC